MPLATIYIAFVLQFIYEVNDNLFPVVACDVKTQSGLRLSTDLVCLLFAAIEVNR